MGRAARLAGLLLTAIAPAGCMGIGGAGTPPAATTVTAPAQQAAASADAALLDVFRSQLPQAAKMLDKTDDVYAERSAQLALEYDRDGQLRPWTNPESGTTGTITPTRTFQKADTYCRAYSQTIQIRQRGSKDVTGQAEAKAGVACRQADGQRKFQRWGRAGARSL